MSRGFYTVFPKNSDTKFVVKNIAPFGKRIKIFNYPIINGGTRDLLSIPEISEATIRHSLLKGEIVNKLRCKEITIVESDIDLTQYNAEQRAFLESMGVTIGLGPDGGGSGLAEIPYLFKEDVLLIGAQDGVNRTFMTPDIFLDGIFGDNEFHISIRHNGRWMVQDEEFVISESGGSGTGYDTITFITFAPKADSEILVNYTVKK